METGKVLIPSCFEIVGEKVKQIIHAGFSITDEPIYRSFIQEGFPSYGSSGVIYQQNAGLNDITPNVKVVALKNGIVYDFATTDSYGEYTLYLEDGVYDIRIEGQAYTRVVKNYQVTNGIKPYRKLIQSGQILNKIYDVIEFAEFDRETKEPIFDDGLRMVSGVILDEQGKPFEGAEIIVAHTDGKDIRAFVKTGKDGKYSFVIGRENYDIIIRSPRHHAKVLRNYPFIPDEGFLPQIINNSLMYRKGGEWLWISN